MTDNVDFAKRFIFQLPSVRRLILLAVGVGVLFGMVSTAIFAVITPLTWNVPGAAAAAVLLYVVPAIIFAEIAAALGWLRRQWGYVIAIVDMAVLFLFTLVAVMADAMGEVWQLMWVLLATMYVSTLLMVVAVKGEHRLRNLVMPLAYPAWLLILFHVFIGQYVGIPRILYVRNSGVFLLSAFLLVVTFRIFDFLIRANVNGLSTLDFTSVLILGEERKIPGGVETTVPHHALHIDNGDTLICTVPGVHAGPVAGFGGGRLTSTLITDRQFVLHAPSNHTLDMANPRDMHRFYDPPQAELQSAATRMVSAEVDGFTVRGRRYGDTQIIYLQNRDIDDYAPAIVQDLRDAFPAACFVDLHNQPVVSSNPELQELDARVDGLRSAVEQVMAQLSDEPLHPYHAGFHKTGDMLCLYERVDGQETCLLGVNGNGAPASLLRAADQVDADLVLPFSTDTHESLIMLATPDGFETGDLLDCVARAKADVSTAQAGIGSTSLQDLRVLGKDYESLIFTLNIMARLIPVALVLYYVALLLLLI